MLVSGLRKSQPTNPPPTAPPAFGPKKTAYAPPPRRAPSPEPQPAPEEPSGEWADALYDYDSTVCFASIVGDMCRSPFHHYQDPGDLPIRENQRVLVTERTSADWYDIAGSDYLPGSNYLCLGGQERLMAGVDFFPRRMLRFCRFFVVFENLSGMCDCYKSRELWPVQSNLSCEDMFQFNATLVIGMPSNG